MDWRSYSKMDTEVHVVLSILNWVSTWMDGNTFVDGYGQSKLSAQSLILGCTGTVDVVLHGHGQKTIFTSPLLNRKVSFVLNITPRSQLCVWFCSSTNRVASLFW